MYLFRLTNGKTIAVTQGIVLYSVFLAVDINRLLIGGGGEVSPRKSVVQSVCQYDVTSRISDFQNGEQSVHRRD